jgi:hypothetical protein
MIHVLAILVWIFAVTLSSVAHADDGTVWVVGPKQSSCGTFLQAVGDLDEGWRLWVLGFWSGMNWEAANRQKGMSGSSTDQNGILQSVKKRCQDDPALSVAFVTAKLHEEFEKNGR